MATQENRTSSRGENILKSRERCRRNKKRHIALVHKPKKNKMVCCTCEQLSKALKKSSVDAELCLDISLLKGSGYSKCSSCGPILDRASHGLYTIYLPVRPSKDSLHGASNLQVSVYERQFPGLELVQRVGPFGHIGLGKILDPQWIDTSILRHWKENCEKYHISSCTPHANAGPRSRIHPRWLIDTWRMCLSRGNPGDRYVALSYVWGTTNKLKTEEATRVEFQKDQAFSQAKNLVTIPKTIQDAMSLLGILRERYLWVDSLCIVQDNKDLAEKQDDLNNMDQIYANACITIIAAGAEHADSGIVGLRGISRPRTLHQEVFPLPNGYKLVSLQRSDLDWSTWSQRAWTFQEYLLSPRRKIFEDNFVRWECGSDARSEDVFPKITLDTRLDEVDQYQLFRGALSSTWPDFHIYGLMVTSYNSKELTYPRDSLAAFSGISSALSHLFPGGFLSGLPELFFDAALLWEASTALEPRNPKDQSSANCLPTWSWAAWHGKLQTWTWSNNCDYIKSGPIGVNDQTRSTIWTTPILTWYSVEAGGTIKRPILNSWTKYKSDHLVGSRNLPPGWTRHRNIIEQSGEHLRRNEDLDEQKYFFTNEKAPGTQFWYPIPLVGDDETPIIRATGSLLFCHTRRTWFQTDKISGAQASSLARSLEDDSGTRVGILFLHNNNLTPETAGSGLQKPMVELIAISEGHADKGHAVTDLGKPLAEIIVKLGEQYRFYNVLWIGRRGAIEYRKGLGRVLKEAWESQNLQCIDVTLG